MRRSCDSGHVPDSEQPFYSYEPHGKRKTGAKGENSKNAFWNMPFRRSECAQKYSLSFGDLSGRPRRAVRSRCFNEASVDIVSFYGMHAAAEAYRS